MDINGVKKPTIISIFAGCGGSSLGYKWAGFKELLAIEWDKNAVETFKLNFPEVPIWQKDINLITSDKILEFCKIKKGELDILDGSPPCQGFSMAGKRQVNDDRNDLFKEFVRLIDGLQPKTFVMENVSGLIKGKMKGKFIEIMTTLKSLNYQVKCKMMNAKYYQVPQSRERLIWIGVRKDLNIESSYPEVIKKVITVKEVLKGIKPDLFLIPKSYMKWAIKLKQGQCIQEIHPKGFGFNMRKLYWNKPSFTVTKTHTPAVGLLHPSENRFLALNELLRITSFPDNYKYLYYETEAKTIRENWARLGNAVMPKMMEAIARNIKDYILEPYYVNLLYQSGDGINGMIENIGGNKI